MSAQKTDPKFIAGLLLILAGAVVCLNMFLLAVGIPLFAIGAILVLISKKSIATKLITILLPVALWFAAFKLVDRYIMHAKSEILVTVPDSFSGQVRIVYGENGGATPKETDGKMELEVPENGVLIIKPQIKAGIQDVTYMFKNKSGTPFTVAELNNKTAAPPVAYYEGTLSPTSNLDYLFVGFQVKRNDTDGVTGADVKNALTDSLVKVSRGGK